MMIQLSNGSRVPLTCTVCGAPAVTTLYNTSLASSVHPTPVLGNYCAEHNPLPNIFTSSRGVSKAAFKQFLDRLYIRIPLRLDQIEAVLDDDVDPLIEEWFYEWAQE